jgi:hypothetical protein
MQVVPPGILTQSRRKRYILGNPDEFIAKIVPGPWQMVYTQPRKRTA